MAEDSPGRTLVVVRHAKAEDAATTDAQRRLTNRGRADAAALGESLGELLDPTLFDDGEPVALVSSAVRARETWAEVAAGLGPNVDVQVRDDLYEAGPDEVVEVLTQLDDEVALAVVVGHNPTIEALALLLDDGSEEALSEGLGERGLSTASFAVLAVPGAWSELESSTCRLTHLGRGRA